MGSNPIFTGNVKLQIWVKNKKTNIGSKSLIANFYGGRKKIPLPAKRQAEAFMPHFASKRAQKRSDFDKFPSYCNWSPQVDIFRLYVYNRKKDFSHR